MHKNIGKRVMALLLSLCMIAGMVDWSGLTVHAALDNWFVSVKVVESYKPTYDGTTSHQPQNNQVIVLDLKGNKVPADKFVLTYGENKEAVTDGTVTATPTEEASAEYGTTPATGEFKILPKDLSAATVTVGEGKDLVLQRPQSNIRPSVKVELDGKLLKGDMATSSGGNNSLHYTYTISPDYINASENEKDLEVTVTGQGNYTGIATGKLHVKLLDEKKFKLVYKTEGNTEVPVDDCGPFSDGTNAKPLFDNVIENLKVYYDSQEITDKTLYELRYENNIYASRKEKAKVYAVGTAAGDYNGFTSNAVEYTVRKAFNAPEAITPLAFQVRGSIEPKSFLGSNQQVTLEAEDITLIDPNFPNEKLELGKDYEISGYGPNNKLGVNAGEVTLQGIGAYISSMTLNFDIIATVLSSSMVNIDDTNCIYDGKAQHGNLKVTVQAAEGGEIFKLGKDYTLSFSSNDINAGKTHTVTVTPTQNGRLQGNPVTKNYEIHPCPLNENMVGQITANGAVYNGNPHNLEPVVSGLIKGTDYGIKYSDNINAGRVTVTISGRGNYTGDVLRYFDIEPQTIDGIKADVAVSDISAETYTGAPITKTINLTVEGRKLTYGTDYEINYRDNTNAGEATMEIVGKSPNYTGSITRTFTINPRDIKAVSSRNVESPVEYTGNPIRAKVTLVLNGRTLEENTDYTLEYKNNTQVGSNASVTITGTRNFTGEETVTFRINPRNIGVGDSLKVTATGGANGNSDYILSDTSKLDENYYKYEKGKEIKPNSITVIYDDGDTIQQALTEGTDYNLSYSKCDSIGTVTITISGIGNWGGKKEVQYKIKGYLGDYGATDALTEIKIPVQIYTGGPIIPDNFEVTFDGAKTNPLSLGIDYEVKECSNNTDVTTVTGKAKANAVLQGKGDYYGETQNIEFDIRPFNLTTDDWVENEYIIDNVKESYIYSGLPIQPIPKIKHFGRDLTENRDYTVDYNPDQIENPNIAANKEGEKWKFRVNGEPDNYEGFKDIEFEIKRYDISNKEYAKIRVEGVEPSVVLDWLKNPDSYTGLTTKAQLDDTGEGVVFPELKVYYIPVDINGNNQDERELTADEYEVKYDNNDTIGTAMISITGIGNFDGTITEEFQIKGDLAGANTSLEVDKHWVYRPESAGGNTPEPVVKYTVHHASGDEEITLTKDKDYTVSYDGNTDATKGAGDESALEKDPATVKIAEVSQDGTVTGRGVGTKSAEFDIFQKDISKAAGEGEEKDPDLEVGGVDPDGYEYTGEAIVPAFVITYLGHELAKGEKDDSSRDYDVTPYHNTNVWDEETGEKSNTYATLAAKTNEDGAYDGNYYGKFDVKFTINPRKISEETIDTPEHKIENSRIGPAGTIIDGNSTYIGTFNATGDQWECDYTKKAITFPKEGKELVEPEKLSDGLTVTWYRNGVNPTVLEEKKDYTVTYANNVAVGDGEILIKAADKSNYEGEFTKKFKIMLSLTEVLNPEPRYMDLSYDHDVPYGIVDVYPELKFEDKTGFEAGTSDDYKILEEGRDFEIVTEANHVSLGVDGFSKNMKEIASEDDEENPPTLVVAGKGHYKGNITVHYNIVPKDFSKEDSGITVEFVGIIPNDKQYTNSYIYDGQPKGRIRVYNNDPKKIGTEGYNIYDPDRSLREVTNYNILEWKNNVDISTETSKASVTIEGVGPYYTGKRTIEFSIVPQPIQDAVVTVPPQTFDRKAKEPEISVKFNNRNLVEGTDYTIEGYENNTNACLDALTAEAPPTIIIKGIGGYGGEKRIAFNIAQEDINNKDDIEVIGRAIYVEGNPIKPTIIVRAKDGTVLNETIDYTVDEYTGPEEINVPGTVMIHGMGNYKGDRTVSFMIYPPDGEFVIEPIAPQEFQNTPIKPEVKVSLKVSEEVSMELVEGQDYVLEWNNIQNAGENTAEVTAKGLGYFEEKGMKATQKFTILPKSISNEDGTIASGISLGSIGVQQYTGSSLTPKATLTFSPSVQPAIREGEEEPGKPVELIAGRDYTVSYDKNVMPGKAKAIITGINNYAGKLETEFEIHADMSKVTIAPIPTQDYTGSAVTPLPTVSLGGQRLTLDTDYRVTYSNNVDRGTATITIEGIEPWYVGKRTVNFDIARELSSETSIRGVAASYTYTGAAIAPPVRVEDDGNLLKNGVDYEVTYSENVNAGTATIVIKGIGKYTGSTSTSFKISPQQLGRAKVSQVSDRIYDGKEQNPPITVTSGDKTLENGKDYTLVYVNSATPGMASVIVKGEGNYTGTQTVNYRISVPSLTGVKFSKSTDKTVTISWTKNSVVTGYEIYNSKNRRAVRVSKASTTQGTVKKLKAGTAATFRVRAYVNKDGQYYYGPFTSVKTVTAPSATKITSLTSKKAKQAVVKWKKVSGATQYEVYRSTSKKGKYKKIATTKKTSYTDKKATGGKKYFYKIRVCKKISKKNYYSSYSAVKSVKAKK